MNSYQQAIPSLSPPPHPAVAGLLDHKSKKIRDAMGPYADQLPVPPDPETDINNLYHLNADQRRANELAYELEAGRLALEILRPKADKLRAKASAEFCAQMQGDYQVIAGRVCSALIELGRAMEAHRGFIKNVIEQGAAYSSLRPLNIEMHYGSPSDRSSELRRHLDDAVYMGHFDAAKIPLEWPKQ